MISLTEYLTEAKIDYSNIDSELIDDLANTDSSEFNDDMVDKLLNELKKLGYKPLRDFLDIVDILSLSREDLRTFHTYYGDKKNVKRLEKVKKSVDKVMDNLTYKYCDAINSMVVYLFNKKANGKKGDLSNIDDVIKALSFDSKDYFITDNEISDKKALGNFEKWADLCKDLSTTGSFNYTKLSKSYNDFKGLLDDYSKYIDKYKSKFNDKQLDQINLINAFISEDFELCKDIVSKDKYGAFDPWVVRYVDNSGFSYILDVCLQLSIIKYIKISPDQITHITPNNFDKFMNKIS